jgi:AraC-like DNA-binding protein
MKIFEGLSNSKNMVFNMKKLLTMVWTWFYGEGAKRSDPRRMSRRSCGFRPTIAGLRQWRDQCRHLPSALETACGPGNQRTYCDAKYVFRQIQRQPTTPLKPTNGCWRNLGVWQISNNICWTWIPGLLSLQRFAGKSPGYTSRQFGSLTSVYCRGMGPGSGRIHLPDLPLVPPMP